MKELSIEEKARAYDEALERARKEMSKDGIKNDVIVCGVMKKVFPELTKSEDEKTERILYSISSKMSLHLCDIFTEEEFQCFDTWSNVWLEKQDTERKQLYVRFGDIPSNEKSKIYHGEDEIGDENGVSVYPAFELNGNIVLGLTLPITMTTLYTQQHLLEYDNRPCYLVSGDYVGKGTDGEPLIRNISIIKRLYNYRIKEFENQGEQKPSDKVEPKFKVGDWIVRDYDNNRVVNQVITVERIDEGCFGYTLDDKTYFSGSWENSYHLWTIQDVKDGDVLTTDTWTFIFKKYQDKSVCYYCAVSIFNNFSISDTGEFDSNYVHPATKEQCDLLFSKMKEAGYEWDSEKKELKKIEQIQQLKQEWNEEDEKLLNSIIEDVMPYGECPDYPTDEERECYYYGNKKVEFLKSLRPQNTTVTDEELAQAKKDAYNDALDKIEYHSGEPTFDDGWSAAIWYLKKKNAQPQNTWKPSDEQMEIIYKYSEQNNYDGSVLTSLYRDLKKLKGE